MSLTIYQPYILSRASFNFDTPEMKVFFFILKSLRDTYIKQINGDPINLFQKDLFGNLHFTNIPIKQIDPHVNYARTWKALKKCNEKVFEINNLDYKASARFIEMPKYNHKEGTVSFSLNNDLVPAFTSLTHGHVQYKLDTMFLLGAKAQRMFILMSEHGDNGIVKISAKKLRRILGLENSYPRFSKFKSRIIDPAEKLFRELFEDGKSDLFFQFDKEASKNKSGDEWDRMLHFKVVSYKNYHRKVNNISANTLSQDYQQIVFMLSLVYQDNKEYLRVLVNHIVRLSQEEITKLNIRLAKLSNEFVLTNNPSVQKLVSKIMKEDYGYKTASEKWEDLKNVHPVKQSYVSVNSPKK